MNITQKQLQIMLYAAWDRNIIVYDSEAEPAAFTLRLVALARTVQRRNAGTTITHIIGVTAEEVEGIWKKDMESQRRLLGFQEFNIHLVYWDHDLILSTLKNLDCTPVARQGTPPHEDKFFALALSLTEGLTVEDIAGNPLQFQDKLLLLSY